jgi:hypothetical protein
MRRPHLIAALLLAGLAMLIGWIAVNTYWDTVKVPGLMHGEALRDPFYAAGGLTRRLGATLRDIRDPLVPLPPRGQVLLLVNTNLELQPERLRQMEDWVMNGGQLIVDQSASLGDQELRRWAGVTQSFVERKRGKRKDAGAGDDTPDDGAGDEEAGANLHALLRQSCVSYSQRGAAVRDDSAYELCDFDPRTRLHTSRRPDFALGDADGLQVLRVPLGRGSLSLLNAYTPFDNRDLLRGDHALLFAVLTRLRAGTTVWTLRGGAGPGLLALVWSRAAGVVLLAGAALCLALWRAATRFGPIRSGSVAGRRSLRAQIGGTARFLLARGGDAVLLQAATRALDAALARRMPHHVRLAPQERVTALARLTGLPDGELADALYGASRPHTNVPRRLGVLEQARRRLLDHAGEHPPT